MGSSKAGGRVAQPAHREEAHAPEEVGCPQGARTWVTPTEQRGTHTETGRWRRQPHPEVDERRPRESSG